MSRLAGRVALVTGGASGIGEGIVRRLADEGAHVVIADVASGQSLADEVGGTYLPLDVTSEADWASTITAIDRDHGALHMLVNNAGVGGPFAEADPETTALDDWRRVQQVNVEGTFLGCRAALPLIRRSGGGSIVNLASTAGLVGTPEFVAYGASKAAVRHLTKSIALHCRATGGTIRCNSVHPGIVWTDMMRRICDDLAQKRGVPVDEIIDSFRPATADREFSTPRDIGDAVVFLASDESRWVSGNAIVLDGGATAGV